jgi:glycosyltransferase involved in cell wall biosynthesis
LLATADIVVHPSVFPDPLPNAIREAMILGKPVIGSRIGGIPEIILDGVTGCLVEPGDPAQLARALHQLLEDPGQRRQLGERAAIHATNHFNINYTKSEYHKIIRHCIMR